MTSNNDNSDVNSNVNGVVTIEKHEKRQTIAFTGSNNIIEIGQGKRGCYNIGRELC